ncbi:hypothetical protein SAMN02745824_2380 [Parasphingorhabdus marina DSM 22363]|uniref:Uncharacterized protein n=1 Tax=Parasphingorhabdus marina DSM 22363 TaxID=1123272 RepID=A0A1N6FG92_9SPHN|nr:hypothetical protein [Parasphingorhabdus marina]SIN94265.1 hypothetical protein SAMN02745824_2380 [Parasphingorhabdus marina DSM 22363]
MNRFFGAVVAATIALSLPVPVEAGWKLIAANQEVKLKKSGMLVTPKQEWNRWTRRPGKKAEAWTLDGLSLNEITFYGGLQTGDTLLKDRKKKTKPLPKFDSTMLVPDVVQWFEATNRIVLDTALFEIDAIEPAQFADQPGFRFTYHYVATGNELVRKGEAMGAIVDGELYLINYTAPEIHFFEHNRDDFLNLVNSVRLTGK